MSGRNRLFCFVLLFVAILYASGCGPTVGEQRDWVDRLFLTKGRLENALDHSAGQRVIEARQLREFLGSPDYMLTVRQLQQRLSDRTNEQKSHRQRVMDRIEQEYREFSRLRQTGNGAAGEPALDNCELWLYDETRHFPRDLPFPVLFGPPEGFHCGIFLLEGGRVIGALVLDQWRSIEKK